jgi:hypothetical protein
MALPQFPSLYATFFTRATAPYRRRAVAAVALVNYLVVCLGVPLPSPHAAPPPGVRYPCENHHCGCPTAEACWRHCCCMTMQQKLAWARENHVEVPAFVWELIAQGETEKAPRHACCCHAAAAPQKASCCYCAHEAPSRLSQSTHRMGWLVYLEQQRCHGCDYNGLTVPWALPLVPPAAESPLDRACGPVFPRILRIIRPEAIAPPDPPPRAV